MRSTTLALCFLLLAPLSRLPAAESSNGEAIFNSNCANCHGSDGSGGRGPNLRGRLRNGNQVLDIENVVRNGLPGTAMPKFDLEQDELQAVARYVKSFSQGAVSAPHPEGDIAAGKRLYNSRGCSSCHKIGNEGSAFGPDLTRIGAARSYEYLKMSITDPSADVPEDYQGITIVTHDGKRFQGAWVNEDSFTVQIRLPDQSFASFDKQTLEREVHEKRSLMPVFNFSETDLNNLLSYLSSLNGAAGPTSQTEKEPRLR